MSKTLLLLGGARYALPVIDAAHELGARVVTCDFLPHNYAHNYSDAYINASIVDGEAVLAAARQCGADGIMSFAADPGVVAASYAAEKLELPFQGSYRAVSILQDKERYRTFLRDNGFNCPELHFFRTVDEAMAEADSIAYPVMAKPVDSAGSKGCSCATNPCELRTAVEYALKFSRDGRCIVEQFLEKQGDSSDADGFIVDGEFKCVSFTSQLFDPKVPNPYTPAAYTMPATMPTWAQDELVGELQRLANLLGLRDGVFNIETRVATNDKAYIMESSPRGGGNRLCEMLRHATGGKVDLIRCSVQSALGEPIDTLSMPAYDGFWFQQMLHSDHGGIFVGLEYASGFADACVVEEQLWVEPGAKVEAFTAANHAFGSVMLRFDTRLELDNFRNAPGDFMRVKVS
ncbi:ATP-grasp domain-containing protein [Paraeggerthella hongkongensis]|uniref:Carboxylate--amine ligase n=1 Tax=Paraeggerthella hongkongensis TaxID=230658 RepID=A0A3N0BDW8_9ACTN|nr:ATP-grasp domain-containing protein [Paraeggerthella hongkongensis]RNL45775.1 carboxylate--amine ligase [Paraeggerthella hongkongensis]